jgi:SOS-response transcriptional repressor LexA
MAIADESGVDVYGYLVKNLDDTYGIFVQGDSITTEDGVSIESGDLILVDRVVEPTSKSIVVAEVDGALIVKRIADACEWWGVVTFVVKRTYSTRKAKKGGRADV